MFVFPIGFGSHTAWGCTHLGHWGPRFRIPLSVCPFARTTLSGPIAFIFFFWKVVGRSPKQMA